MKNKSLFIIILIFSVIGFSSGIYYKFIKSYSDEKLQVETTNIGGDTDSRKLKLGEMISMLEEMESIKEEYHIQADENNDALKRLKTTNTISIITMVVCFILFIWTIKKIKK